MYDKYCYMWKIFRLGLVLLTLDAVISHSLLYPELTDYCKINNYWFML